MKTKTLVFEVDVPHYWDTNDIKGVPYDEEGNEIKNITEDTDIWEYKGGLENMLNETLVFAEKKYNKRIDGEGHCWGHIYESRGLYIGQLNPNVIKGGKDD